jgi:hypothetical protein
MQPLRNMPILMPMPMNLLEPMMTLALRLLMMPTWQSWIDR